MRDFFETLFIRTWIAFSFICAFTVLLSIICIILKFLGWLILSWNAILIPGGIALILLIVHILIYIEIGNNS